MSSQDAERVADRYGRPAPWRRPATIAVSVALALAFGGWLAWTTWLHSTPDADGALVRYTVEGQHQVDATVSVRISEDTDPSDVRCLLRAYAEDHSVVGERNLTPSQSGSLSVEIRTEREATAVELVDCTVEK